MMDTKFAGCLCCVVGCYPTSLCSTIQRGLATGVQLLQTFQVHHLISIIVTAIIIVITVIIILITDIFIVIILNIIVVVYFWFQSFDFFCNVGRDASLALFHKSHPILY